MATVRYPWFTSADSSARRRPRYLMSTNLDKPGAVTCSLCLRSRVYGISTIFPWAGPSMIAWWAVGAAVRLAAPPRGPRYARATSIIVIGCHPSARRSSMANVTFA